MSMTNQPASRQQRGGQRGDGSVAIHRWDPLQQMENMYQTMGALLQNFIGDDPTGRAAGAGWTAPADIEETDDAFVVELDAPSVKPEDIDVELRDNMLLVCGEVKERERAGVVRRRSRRVGRFEHAVALPGDVDADKVDAKLSDGVLTVRVAKSAASQPRRIAVKAG